MSEAIALSFAAELFRAVAAEPQAAKLPDCLTCMACVSRCTWRGAEGSPDPLKMLRLAALGLDEVLAAQPDIFNCTLCNRCMVGCPMGLEMATMVRRARNHPVGREHWPEDFKKGIPTRLEVGNVNGVEEADYRDTVEWLSEELATEVDDPEACLPLDQIGARYAYLPNPREIENGVMHFTAMAKLFYALGEPWTLSSKNSDVTNWGYYMGDDASARAMLAQVIEGFEALEIEALVLSECGHGFQALRKYAQKIYGRAPRFRVLTMSELLLPALREGKIRLDPTKNPERVAYHDPCNIGRKGGLFDEPREVLRYAVREVVELEPTRELGLCCGGGGGVLQDSTSHERRMAAGRAKFEQMRRTGCETVTTSCLSCQRQLMELGKHYGWTISSPTVAYLAAKALALTPK